MGAGPGRQLLKTGPLGSPDGEAESTAHSRVLACSKTLPEAPWQLDSSSPSPGLAGPALMCFRDSGIIGALAGATPAQHALLPLPLLWHSVTSSNRALRLHEGKCPSFKSNWLQALHKSPFFASAPGVPSAWAAGPPRWGSGFVHVHLERFLKSEPHTGSGQRPSSPFGTQGAPSHSQSAADGPSAARSGGCKLGPTSSLRVSPNSGRGTPTRPGRAEPEDRKESGKSQGKREKSERVKEKEREAK